MQEEEFLRENGYLLSKFEEVQGQFLLLKSQLRSQKAIIEGLNYDLAQSQAEIERLKLSNKRLREQLSAQEARFNEQSILVSENFKIRNNFSKIVTDIEEKGSAENVNLKEFLSTLIEEIDICINQLSMDRE
ncbi:hypothetical protein [Leadbetterella byssophila]|jgi:uncharacterized coiled-coil protein SlyX|uniref:Uncharacterized protein n=1 Tax=Leadbetterella byssophila (strain DSM 17132 / JCM 16389 / KACC 11308 / NBRC 106382 / 4M15) TaxID=649349 RepID=E4RRR6_LEAB4|nr:hypothetical protein [Leadbetterella byssophila]ADQ17603.1 hypothetical protein Lbys_1901 [Leadbetterella byssophila DSM 17132]